MSNTKILLHILEFKKENLKQIKQPASQMIATECMKYYVWYNSLNIQKATAAKTLMQFIWLLPSDIPQVLTIIQYKVI